MNVKFDLWPKTRRSPRKSSIVLHLVFTDIMILKLQLLSPSLVELVSKQRVSLTSVATLTSFFLGILVQQSPRYLSTWKKLHTELFLLLVKVLVLLVLLRR